MSNYRVYLIGADGKITSRYELDSSDDEAAIASAEKIAAGRNAELWQLARFIKKFNAVA